MDKDIIILIYQYVLFLHILTFFPYVWHCQTSKLKLVFLFNFTTLSMSNIRRVDAIHRQRVIIKIITLKIKFILLNGFIDCFFQVVINISLCLYLFPIFYCAKFITFHIKYFFRVIYIG